MSQKRLFEFNKLHWIGLLAALADAACVERHVMCSTMRPSIPQCSTIAACIIFDIVISPRSLTSRKLVIIPQSTKLSPVKIGKSHLTAVQCAPCLASACCVLGRPIGAPVSISCCSIARRGGNRSIGPPMSVLFTIIDALLPIALVILLGIVAGHTGMIKSEQSSVLADLALDFCLPSLLFVATATMSTAELSKWQFFLGIALWLLAVYVVAFLVALLVFRKRVGDSSLQALSSAFPNMAFIGIPVLSAVMGAGARLSVVVGNLLSIFVLIPLTLTLLEAGSAGQKGCKIGAVVLESVPSAVKKPLVWGPLLGVLT